MDYATSTKLSVNHCTMQFPPVLSTLLFLTPSLGMYLTIFRGWHVWYLIVYIYSTHIAIMIYLWCPRLTKDTTVVVFKIERCLASRCMTQLWILFNDREEALTAQLIGKPILWRIYRYTVLKLDNRVQISYCTRYI